MQHIFSHILEIKLRSFYFLISFVFTFIACYKYQIELLYILGRPFIELHHKFIFIDLTEAFYTTLRVCTITSLLCIFPYGIYQLWSYFIPSCYISERKFVNIFILLFCFFLLLELSSIYCVVFPTICDFFLSYELPASGKIQNQLNTPLIIIEYTARIESYIKLTIGIFLLLLTLFQIPFLFLFIYYYKWLTCYDLCKNRKLFLFCCVLMAAFLSPPDIISQSFITFFLFCIYEFLIFIGFLFEITLKKLRKGN